MFEHIVDPSPANVIVLGSARNDGAHAFVFKLLTNRFAFQHVSGRSRTDNYFCKQLPLERIRRTIRAIPETEPRDCFEVFFEEMVRWRKNIEFNLGDFWFVLDPDCTCAPCCRLFESRIGRALARDCIHDPFDDFLNVQEMAAKIYLTTMFLFVRKYGAPHLDAGSAECSAKRLKCDDLSWVEPSNPVEYEQLDFARIPDYMNSPLLWANASAALETVKRTDDTRRPDLQILDGDDENLVFRILGNEEE